MIDITQKLNHEDYIDHEESVEELIQNILDYGWEFYYKNVSYLIDFWDHPTWAVQTNSSQHDCGVKYSIHFFQWTKESLIEVFENFKLHDGTTLYDAVTKKGFGKYFIYDENAKY